MVKQTGIPSFLQASLTPEQNPNPLDSRFEYMPQGITIDSLLKAEADKTKLVAELKQLKELLDAKIITETEFDSKKNALMEKW